MNLLIIILATWRLSALFSYECGPWDIFKRFRRRIGISHHEYILAPDPDEFGKFIKIGEVDGNCEPGSNDGNFLTELFSCVWCLSLWFAIIVFVLYQYWPGETILILSPFALSAGVIIVERISRG